MCSRVAEKQLAQMLISLEIADHHFCILQKERMESMLSLVFKLCVCVCVEWAWRRGVRSWVVSWDAVL